MATRYALTQFVFHNSVTNSEEVVIQGAARDTITSQAFLQSPLSFWGITPLSAAAGQITGVLAQYLASYPAT